MAVALQASGHTSNVFDLSVPQIITLPSTKIKIWNLNMIVLLIFVLILVLSCAFI